MSHLYVMLYLPLVLTCWTGMPRCRSDLVSLFSADVMSKTEISLLLRNPDIVFVADLTRADAPALVMSTQCELLMKSCAEGSQITAVINDLKVRNGKYIILRKKSSNKIFPQLLTSSPPFLCRLWHAPFCQRRGKII